MHDEVVLFYYVMAVAPTQQTVVQALWIAASEAAPGQLMTLTAACAAWESSFRQLLIAEWKVKWAVDRLCFALISSSSLSALSLLTHPGLQPLAMQQSPAALSSSVAAVHASRHVAVQALRYLPPHHRYGYQNSHR